MNNLVVVLICLAIGLLLQRNKQLPENFSLSLNLYVIYIAFPALVLLQIHGLQLNSAALLPIVFAWVLMLSTALIIWVIAKKLQWSPAVTGALMLTVPLGNTGFLGVPLIEILLGDQALPYAILYDQFGSFIALNTYGCITAAYYSGGNSSKKELLMLIIKFPPFIALLAALFLIPVQYPQWLSSALIRISTTLVPVVMVAVGFQWRLRLERDIALPLCVGLLVSLVITPALALGLLQLFGIHGLVGQVIVLEAAMPAMITAGILAARYQLAPRLAASLVGYSLLFSLLTLWLWRQFL